MAWTAAQLAQIESAIMAVSLGAQEVEIDGKRYRKPNLNALKKLRDEMKTEIQTDSDGGRTRVAFVDKSTL